MVKDVIATTEGVIAGRIIFDDLSDWKSQTGHLGTYQADDAGNLNLFVTMKCLVLLLPYF